MALIYTLLEWAKERPTSQTPRIADDLVRGEMRCGNRQCISNCEDVDRLFRPTETGDYRCAYCESKVKQ